MLMMYQLNRSITVKETFRIMAGSERDAVAIMDSEFEPPQVTANGEMIERSTLSSTYEVEGIEEVET